MAKGKQTPRQKMINLMYLVFIAMLALQIDQEILRSYNDTNTSLYNSRLLTQKNNDQIFEVTLQQKARAVPDTYLTRYEDYKQLKEKLNSLVSLVDTYKDGLKKASDYDFKTKDISDNYSALNNTEASTAYFFSNGEETMPSAKAKDLLSGMNGIKTFIKEKFGNQPRMQDLINRANTSLNTDQKIENKNWLAYKFYNKPLIAALSNLEIIQSDLRNIQSDALILLLQEKVDADVKFNTYEAIVSAPTDIQAGNKAEAVIMLANISNSNKISISGVDRVENGKGYKALSTSGIGKRTFGGTITLTNSEGKVTSFPYEHTYNIINGPELVKLQTGAVLTADKMNVLYRGLENPMSGNILGADNANLSLTATNAKVSGSSGKWIVVPGAGNTVTLTLSGRGPKGAISQQFTYRIKGLPNPQGQIRGKGDVQMPATSIQNQRVEAAIPDFDFPVNITVTGFKFRVPGRAGVYVKGNSLSEVSGLTKNLKPGDNVVVYDIEATASGIGNQQLKRISNVTIQVL